MADDSADAALAECLAPTPFIECDAPAVQAFVARVAGDAQTEVEKAARLFYAVRDEIRYDPYGIDLTVKGLRATTTLEKGRGFCIAKAVLFAAAARAAGIPARLGFADVRNHLTTEHLKAQMGTDVFAYHGFTELWVEGRWIKATPTFNRTLCERFGVKTLDFDGRTDAVLHPFDAAGNRHMEYVRDRGHATDVPLEDIKVVCRELYPHLYATEPRATTGDFEREAEEDAARRE